MKKLFIIILMFLSLNMLLGMDLTSNVKPRNLCVAERSETNKCGNPEIFDPAFCKRVSEGASYFDGLLDFGVAMLNHGCWLPNAQVCKAPKKSWYTYKNISAEAAG